MAWDFSTQLCMWAINTIYIDALQPRLSPGPMLSW